jgi:hypothetical protein
MVLKTSQKLSQSEQDQPDQGQASSIKTTTVKATQNKRKPTKNKRKKKIRGKNKSKGKPQDNKPTLSLKEQRIEQRKRDRVRKELFSFIGTAFGIGAVIGLLLAIVGGIKAAVGAIIVVVGLSLACKYPRFAMWGFFIYVPFGGTITYAIGNSPLLQLAKDALYLPALMSVIQHCKRERLPFLLPKQIKTPLFILLFLCILTILFVNGSQQFFGKGGEKPIAMGILGLKVMLGYLPLISCTYYFLRDKKDFYFLMRLTTTLIIICCSLAMVQYLLLLTGKCAGTRLASGNDLFKASLSARCFVGGALLYSPQQGVIRLPGTFVAPWQWGWFLISCSFLAFPSAFNEPKLLWRILGLLALGCVFVLAVVSGQRIALALVPIVIALLLVLTGQVANLKRFLPIAIILGVALGGAAVQNPATIQERLDSFISRWNASPPYAFILGQFQWALHDNALLGHGAGRATNAARALGETQLVETYYPKMLFEIGIFGTIAFLCLVTTLTMASFSAKRKIRDRSLRSYASTFSWFLFFMSYNTYYYPLDVDPVSVYFWFFAGAALKLPELDRLAQLEAAKAEGAEDVEPKGKRGKRDRLKRPGFA